MWRLHNDNTRPVITAYDQIHSAHRGCALQLPQTAIVFFMSKCTDYLAENYASEEMPQLFPCFLKRRPIWEMKDMPVCFLDGGGGAPQAADTVETLAVLGVKNIIAVGMFGAFSHLIQPGEIIIPEKAFVEEGTSLHYFESIDASHPDADLHDTALSLLEKRTYPIVSTDAVYRQTFLKEQLWREKGAVGVDMETSAVFSVSSYLGVRATAILMASDMHPLGPDEPKWEWLMSKEMRYELARLSVVLAGRISESAHNDLKK